MPPSDSPTSPPDPAFRLLLRHPAGLQPAESQAIEGAIYRAVRTQQELSRRHPSVRTIDDWRVDDRGFWVKESPADAQPVESMLGQPVEPARLVDLGCRLCDVILETCYEGSGEARPHGAIRPTSVFVAADGRVTVSDFGLAAVVADGVAKSAPREEIALLAAYTAPELWLNPGAVGELKDLFGIGIILYELATGTHPYGVDRRDFVDCERMVIAEARPAAKANPALPQGLAAVLDRAVAKSEQKRFPTLRSLRGALATCLTQPAPSPAERPAPTSSPAPPPAAPSPSEKPARSSRSRKGVIAVAALAVVATLALTAYVFTDAKAAPQCPLYDQAFQAFDETYQRKEHNDVQGLLAGVVSVRRELDHCATTAWSSTAFEAPRNELQERQQALEGYQKNFADFDRSQNLNDMVLLLQNAHRAWPTVYAERLLATCKELRQARDSFSSSLANDDLAAARKALDQANAAVAESPAPQRFAPMIAADTDSLVQRADGLFLEARRFHSSNAPAAEEKLRQFLAVRESLSELADQERRSRWDQAAGWLAAITTFREATAAAAKGTTLAEIRGQLERADLARPEEKTRGLLEELRSLEALLSVAGRFYEKGDWPAVGRLLADKPPSSDQDAVAATALRIFEATCSQWTDDRLKQIQAAFPAAAQWLDEHPRPGEVVEHLRRLEDAVSARGFLDQMAILPPALGGETLDGLVPLSRLNDQERGVVDGLRGWIRATIQLPGDVPLTVLAVPGKGNLTLPIWLAETELTVGQYVAITGQTDWPRGVRENPKCREMIGNPQNPVAYVALADLRQTLQAAELPAGIVLRLPLREQWEQALLAGGDSLFKANAQLRTSSLTDGADAFDPKQCNFPSVELKAKEEIAPPGTGSHSDGFGWYAPVGSYQPNRWGFLDMLGNVQEWTEDRAGQPFACGGSWYWGYAANEDRVAHCKTQFDDSRPFEDVGVRVAMEVRQ